MSQDEFFAGLTLEEHLPLSWQVLSAAPDQTELVSWNTDNEGVLRALGVVEEHVAEVGDDSHNAQEFARLEHKLNLALDLIGQLLAGQGGMPTPVRCRCDSQGIEWQCGNPPPIDALLKVSLYLSRRYPRPLLLLGRVVASPTALPQTCRVRIESLSEALADRLEGHIFRHHRRRIAHARALSKPAK